MARPGSAALLLLAALVASACIGSLATTCESLKGGRDGAQAQLRFVDVSDERVVFVFGLRAGGGFGLPSYVVEPAAPRDAASFLLRFDGAFTTNPDGSPSYAGPRVLAGERLVRELRLRDEDGRSMRWELGLRSPTCPRVRDGEYTASTTFPRARVVLLFRGSSAIVIEPGTYRPGDPVTVSGLGFAPDAQVRLSIAGGEVHRTRADGAGDVSTSVFLPDLAPGSHVLDAADDAGHRSEARLEIAAAR